MADIRTLGNVPAETSSFIGRGRELVELGGYLRRARMISVVGGAGVGKTRVALRAAAAASANFPDGVWFVELSAERDGNLVAGAIAQTLGLREQSARSWRELLAEFLAGKRLLLVLDTCEHIIGDLTDLVSGLLDAAPGLTVLATSRTAFGLAAEKRVLLEAFPMPEPESARPLAYDAVRLFVERGRDRVPGWEPDEAALGTVARLCRKLDGVPLGIELAAAHLQALSVAELADLLVNRFDVLKSGYRGGPQRHRTYRSAVGWSHELCNPRERLLWARLSTFAGRFDAATAQIICSDEHLPDVAEVLRGLADKSIVTERDGRYRLLDSIREYGLEWLRELGEEERMRRAHHDHYLSEVDRLEREWFGPDQLRWAEWVNNEMAEIRVAVEWALGRGEESQRLVSAGWIIWGCLGQMREGRYYLERALATAPGATPAHRKTLWVLAWISIFQGDMIVAKKCGTLALEEARTHGDLAAQGHAIVRLAGVHLLRGEPEKVPALMAEARRLLDESGEVTVEQQVLGIGETMAWLFLGDLGRAGEVIDQMLAESQASGDIWVRSFAQMFQSQVLLATGDVVRADVVGRSSLAIKWRLRDGLGIALVVDQLAAVAAARGDGHRTAWLHGAGERLWAAFGLQGMGAPELALARDQATAAAVTLIGQDSYTKTFEEGFGASFEEVERYAVLG